MEIQAGDILWGKFGYEEGPTEDVHPLLVVDVRGYGCVVAFGTSQKATDGALLGGDLLLSLEEAIACGLSKATRFALYRREMMPLDIKDPIWRRGPYIGHIQQGGDAVMRRFYKAAKQAGLV